MLGRGDTEEGTPTGAEGQSFPEGTPSEPEPEPEPAEHPDPGPSVSPRPTPPIERRAVSLEFLERLLVELTPEMERSATAAAIEFLEQQDWASPATDGSAVPELPVLVAEASNEDFARVIFDLVVRSHRDDRVDAEAMAVLCRYLDQPMLSDRAWERECREVGGDPAVGLSLAQFTALFARPLATPAAALYSQLVQAWRIRRGYGARDLERRRQGPYLSGRDVHRLLIKNKTHGLLCRYVELVGVADGVDADGSPSIGPADVFVSWTWDTPWRCVMETLRAHATSAHRAGRGKLYFWLDIFAINQHTALPPWLCTSDLGTSCAGCAAVGQDMMSMAEMEAGRVDKGFERVINSPHCRETLLVLESWSAPRPVGRVWCLYEILLTLMAAQRGEDNRLVIGLPVDERQQLAAALQTDLVRVQRLIGTVDGENAQASMPSDRDKIFLAVRRMLTNGFRDLNAAVKAALREWTYEAGVQRLAELSAIERCESNLAVMLGQYCEDQGRYTLAEALLQDAVAERTASFGRQDQRTLQAMAQLASVWEGMDRYGQAETLMSEVIDGNRRQLGDCHPRTLEALTNIGLLHRKMAEYDRAKPELLEAVAGRREVLGGNDPDTLQSISLLGALLASMEEYERAEALMKEAVDGRRQVLGEEHPLTLESVNNLGALYEEMGRFSDGEPLMRFAEEARRRILGDDHPGTLDSIGCLGLLLSRMERHDEAEQLLREATDTSRRVLGGSHPDTLIALFNLAELLEASGNGAMLDEAVKLFEEELRGQIAREDREEAADSARQLHRRLIRYEMAEKARELEATCLSWGISLEASSSSDDEEQVD
eukprot:COSAG02_NODE_5876_length_3970_cov_3.517696_2_plen_829_part_00